MEKETLLHNWRFQGFAIPVNAVVSRGDGGGDGGGGGDDGYFNLATAAGLWGVYDLPCGALINL